MTTTAAATLTPNAVRKMIMGEPMEASSGDDPWIVMVFRQPHATTKTIKTNAAVESSSAAGVYQTVTVWDGTDYANAVVIGPLSTALQNNHNTYWRSFTVAVYSYICSEANCKDNEPFLCIIPIGLVQEAQYCSSTLQPFLGRPPLVLPPGKKIKGGIAPVFFSGMAHLLSNHALSGHPSNNITTVPVLPTNAKLVADHLAKQSAMVTLARAATTSSAPSASVTVYDVDNPSNNITSSTSNNNSSRSSNNNSEIINNTKYYMSALREFQESQRGRQNSSLTTNAGREDAVRAALIVQQHDKALHQALLDVAEPLSTALLCKWHSISCGEGVLVNNNNSSNNNASCGGAAAAVVLPAAAAGVIRTKNVRVGNVHFRPHHVVRGDVDSLCQSINSLEQRLLHQSGAAVLRPPLHAASATASLHQSRAGIEVATFAACVFFAVGDVHAFCDGNGRLARIALNWALHKAGIPFVIHLFATPAQRKEYVDATVKTRRNLSLTGQGRGGSQYFSQEDLVHAYEAAGALGPLVDLILDRLGKTIVEFEKLVLEKSRLVYEEAEARAAKAVRDRERAGTCLICFDDNPNIGTLCCGKAVHLNCVAQWLSQNNTCPNCREQFPALPPRLIAPPPEAAAAAAGGAEVEDTESTTGMEQDEDAAGVDDTTTFSDDDGDTTEHMDAADMNAQIVAAMMRLQGQQAALRQEAAAAVAQAAAAQAQQPDDTTEDDTTENDTTVAMAAAAATNNNNNMGDTESTTDSTTAIVAPSRGDNSHLPPFCVMNACSNRAARDCSNNTCGRCCISYGRYSCPRHNN